MKSVLTLIILLAFLSFATLVLMSDSPADENVSPKISSATPPKSDFVKVTTPLPETASSSPAATSTTTSTVASITKSPIPAITPTTTKTTAMIKPETTVRHIKATSSVKNRPDEPVATVPKPVPDPTTSAPISWGVFAGSNPTVIHDFETRVGVNPDYLAYFIHWGNGDGALPAFLSDYAYKKDRTLVIFWEASDYKIGGTDQPSYSYSTMLRGDWDSYFTSFANQLKKYEGPIILIPFSELNGNWTPWSGTKNGNTPELAVAAFQYVHEFFADVPNVQIGWAVNSVSVPQTSENQIERYYPGDEYVDIVGVDGFNMGDPWLSFDEIFGNALRTVSEYGKPVFVFSFGSAEGSEKAAWLQDALLTQMPRYPKLTGWVYFNQNKERNWLLWSDEDTFKVFKEYVTD